MRQYIHVRSCSNGEVVAKYISAVVMRSPKTLSEFVRYAENFFEVQRDYNHPSAPRYIDIDGAPLTMENA